MRNQIRTTSRAAYDDIKKSGLVGAQASLILSYLEPHKNYSLQEICKLSGLPVNSVSGRCNDLKKAGLLVEAPKRPCSVTGRTVHPVALPRQQFDLFQ